MKLLVNAQRKKAGRIFDRYRLKNKSFTLFSDDCWGAEVYKHFGLPFNTPFIGLMLAAPCYLKLLSNPRHYLAQPLTFQQHSRYEYVNEMRATWKHYFPVATIGDVEIQFLHYHSDEEASEKWTRRIKRINWDNIFIKFDGGKGATPDLIQEFDRLPFPRLTLLRKPQAGIRSAVVVPHYIVDGLRQFERSLPHFDLVGWLNDGSVRATAVIGIYNKLLFPINL